MHKIYTGKKEKKEKFYFYVFTFFFYRNSFSLKMKSWFTEKVFFSSSSRNNIIFNFSI